jgi:ABC-type sugar transport system ATPase subunit
VAGITIDHLHKRFDDGTVAVESLDLTIPEGELFVLLGPSGCGKTTTLRCIAGLESQTSGDITIGDHLVNGLRASERDIAMVFQFYALYPHKTAYDNIGFPLRTQGIRGDDADGAIRRTAAMLRIEHLLERKPRKLSGGEQQRIALGRAFVRDPEVFLMDEPLTNLDAELREDMRAELKHLQARMGTTTAYVTHDQLEAMSLGHRIAIMNAGELEQVGTPLEVYEHPATTFAASFIGNPPMNLFPVEVAEGGVVGPAGLHLPAPQGLSRGENLIGGVRAEWLALVERGEPEAVDCEIVSRENLGDEAIYAVEVGGEELRVRTGPSMHFGEGDVAGLAFRGDQARVYDAGTGAQVAAERVAA